MLVIVWCNACGRKTCLFFFIPIQLESWISYLFNSIPLLVTWGPLSFSPYSSILIIHNHMNSICLKFQKFTIKFSNFLNAEFSSSNFWISSNWYLNTSYWSSTIWLPLNCSESTPIKLKTIFFFFAPIISKSDFLAIT